MDRILLESEKLVMSLNIPKCESFISGGFVEEREHVLTSVEDKYPDMKISSCQYFSLLGSPVTDKVVTEAADEKVR